MSDGTRFDLSTCRTWRKSSDLGGALVGIIPAWNAVTVLNPAAATIWDLLIESGDPSAVTDRYAVLWPNRADAARADVEACLKAWAQQGLFEAPEPSPEQRRLAAMDGHTEPPQGETGFRRTFWVAGVPTMLEVDDPALARIVEDLLVDFPVTHVEATQKLRTTGPKGGWVLYLDGRPLRVADSLVLARGQIVAELVRLASGATGWLATIHGATLTGLSGPVFLAGSSGAGKSTLSAGLVARGWKILAEDIAGFDAEMTVCPLPFALSIKDGAVDTLAPRFPKLKQARVHQIGPRRVRYQGLPAESRATRPERPRLILDVRYTATLGGAPAALKRLSPVETLALFLNEESYVDFEREDAGGFLDFVQNTPAYKIRYGSIAMAERAIRERLDRHRQDDRG